MTPDESPSDSGGVAPAGDDRLDELPDGVHCVRCGYHLRGVVGPRCPECGYDLAGLRSKESGIPWSHRRKIGRFRAYWATVWAVTVHTRSFCEEYVREVDYRDARLFQWVTILQAFPVLALGIWRYVFDIRAELANRLVSGGVSQFASLTQNETLFVDNWPWIVLTACLMLYLIVATGVPSYLFHPRASSVAKQNAGIALSYYAFGPVATLVPIAAVVVVIAYLPVSTDGDGHGLTIWGHMSRSARGALPVVVGTMAAALPILSWNNLYKLARGMMPQRRRTSLCVLVLLPILWLLLGGLILVVLPGLVVACVVFVVSLL